LRLIEKFFIIISSLISIPFHQSKKEVGESVFQIWYQRNWKKSL